MLKKLILLSVCFSGSLFAQIAPALTLKETTKYSARQLQEWLKTQNRPNFVVPAKYTISGQVSAKWKNYHEGFGSLSPLPRNKSNNQYNIDAEIQFAYLYKQVFGNVRLAFKNVAGFFNGTADSIDLARAYIGYHFITHGPHVLDVNIGRRNTNKLYNSQLMFKVKADGITGFAYYVWKTIVEFQGTMGLYTSNPGNFFVARGRLFNIANLGFYFDYDYVFWGYNKPNVQNSLIDTHYGISQFLVGWERAPKWIGTNIQVFAALLYNARAQASPLTANKRLNTGGYVGIQYGTVKKKGDFSIQGQLQLCGLQVVPEWDMAGIGRGNALKGDYLKATNIRQVNGNTNFKGWQIKLNYSLTDQITMTATLDHSNNWSKAVGVPSYYTNFSLASAYSF